MVQQSVVKQLDKSIQYKELYPHHLWATLRVCFNCDNRSVVDCIHSGTSHCPHTFHMQASRRQAPKVALHPTPIPVLPNKLIRHTTCILHSHFPLAQLTRRLHAPPHTSAHLQLHPPECSPLPAAEHTLMLFSTHLAHSLRPQLPTHVHILHLDWGFPDP